MNSLTEMGISLAQTILERQTSQMEKTMGGKGKSWLITYEVG